MANVKKLCPLVIPVFNLAIVRETTPVFEKIKEQKRDSVR